MSSARDRLRDEIAEQVWNAGCGPDRGVIWAQLPDSVDPGYIDFRAQFRALADVVLTLYGAAAGNQQRDPVERITELLKANNAEVERRRIAEDLLRRIHQIAIRCDTCQAFYIDQHRRDLREIAALSHPEE